MGSAPTGAVYSLAEQLPWFGCLLDRVQRRFVYTNCVVGRMTISSQEGQPIQVTLEIEASTETEEPAVWPAAIEPVTLGQPYIHADTTFSLAADNSASQVRAWTLVIDNVLDADRFMNSITRECIPTNDRNVTLSMQIPYTADSVDLHDQSIAGAAGQLVLTNGVSNTTFDFVNLKSPASTPVTSRRGDEVFLDLNMKAYETVTPAVKELIVTHTI